MPGVRAAALSNRLADWARRRQGSDAQAVTLQRRRIYILPSRFGVAFGAMLFAMLLGSLNYGANLGFAMTFLLCGLGLVLIHHCHNNLLSIRLQFRGSDPVFAGDNASFRVSIDNDTPAPRLDIMARCGEATDGPVDIPAAGSATLNLHFPTRSRGWAVVPRFSVATRYPGNLFRAWTWIHMEARCLVYPAPAAAGLPFPNGAEALGSTLNRTREEDDFVGLREATDTDPPRRIAWKAYARSEQLLVKEFAGGAEMPCLFRFDDLRGLDTETRLSQITRWCIDAAESGRSFGIELPDRRIPLGQGERHLHHCLQALALFKLPS